MRRSPYMLIGICLTGVLSCLPVLKRRDAPRWTVHVRSQTGEPVEGVKIVERWQDYSCERSNHERFARTDALGEVIFPSEASVHTPVSCLLTSLGELGAGVHASLGHHVYVDVYGAADCIADQNGACVDWTGSPPEVKSTVSLAQ